MRLSANIAKISQAILLAQRSMGDAVKGSKNPFFKSSYADLNSIREAVMPALNANGITVMQPTVYEEGVAFVETLLLHESGEFIASVTPIVVAKQNDPQALGSAISYARRYGLQSLLSVGAVDDDGEGAMDRTKAKPRLVEAASDNLAEAVLARAQATVARKKMTRAEVLNGLKVEYGIATDSISDGVNLLKPKQLEDLNKHLEGILNGK